MNFQDSSFNGLKVTVGPRRYRKCDAGTQHACSKSNMPHQFFFKVGGINMFHNTF